MTEIETLDEETEEQAEPRETEIRQWRARKALFNAPSVAKHVRQLALTPGISESGIAVHQESTPLLTSRIDDVDEMYVRLLDWVGYWSETLDLQPPATAVVAWRNIQESHASTGFTDQPAIGFKAGTKPAGAEALTRALTMWLLNLTVRMDEPTRSVFEEDVTKLIGDLRGRYPTSPRGDDTVSPRPCPRCGLPAVHAEWFSIQTSDLEVRCEHCGYILPVRSSLRTREWLPDVHVETDPVIVSQERRKLLEREYLKPSEIAVIFDKTVSQVRRWFTDLNDPLPTAMIEGTKYAKLADVHTYLDNHQTRKR